MITKLDDAFRFHEVALNLRSHRQQILASNIANADTPAYKARDIDFNAELGAALATRGTRPASAMSRSSDRHLAGAESAPAGGIALKYRMPAQASIDGNTVEMDAERAQFADNAVRYEASITLLGMQIKSLLSAIQG